MIHQRQGRDEGQRQEDMASSPMFLRQPPGEAEGQVSEPQQETEQFLQCRNCSQNKSKNDSGARAEKKA